MGIEQRRWMACSLVVLSMLAVAWTPVFSSPEALVLENEEPDVEQTALITDRFAVSNGFTHINMTTSPSTGLTELERPPISWTATTGIGLTQMRTGACSAYLPSTNEVFLIGGRIDIDPSQTGDEANTNTVEIFDLVNKTWEPAAEQLKETQQYHKCAVVDDTIYAIGDHHPFSSPSVEATGVVQVYDAEDGNWSYGTSMPGNQSVGLAGVTSHNGMIYVFGSTDDELGSNFSVGPCEFPRDLVLFVMKLNPNGQCDWLRIPHHHRDLCQ